MGSDSRDPITGAGDTHATGRPWCSTARCIPRLRVSESRQGAARREPPRQSPPAGSGISNGPNHTRAPPAESTTHGGIRPCAQAAGDGASRRGRPRLPGRCRAAAGPKRRPLPAPIPVSPDVESRAPVTARGSFRVSGLMLCSRCLWLTWRSWRAPPSLGLRGPRLTVARPREDLGARPRGPAVDLRGEPSNRAEDDRDLRGGSLPVGVELRRRGLFASIGLIFDSFARMVADLLPADQARSSRETPGALRPDPPVRRGYCS